MMKKKLYFLVTVVISLGCLCGFTACGDDDNEPEISNSTCACTIKLKSGQTLTTTESIVGSLTCKDIQHDLASTYIGATVSCK